MINSLFLQNDNNIKVIRLCIDKMKNLNSMANNFKLYEFKKWKKYFKEMHYYDAISNRLLNKIKELI